MVSIAMAAERKKIEKQILSNKVCSLSDLTGNIKYFRTGIPHIDFNIGGWPAGSILQLAAVEGVGKTTLATHTGISMLRFLPEDRYTAFADFEGRLNLMSAKKVCDYYGVNKDRFKYYIPTDGQDGLGVVEEWIDDPKCVMIIGDSLKTVIDEKDIGRDIADNFGAMADQKLVANFLKKHINSFNKRDKVMLWVDQLKEDGGIGMFKTKTTKSGKSVKFYSSLIIYMGNSGKKKKRVVDGVEEEYGGKVYYKVKKSTVCPNVKVSDIPILYGKGVSVYAEYFKKAKALGFVTIKAVKKGKDEPVATKTKGKKKKGKAKSVTYIDLDGKSHSVGDTVEERNKWCKDNRFTLYKELEDRCYDAAFKEFKLRQNEELNDEDEEFDFT